MASESLVSQAGLQCWEARLSQQIHALVLAGFGHPKRLWVLGRLERTVAGNQPGHSDEANCPSELFALAFAILGLALRAKLAPAKGRLHARWYRMSRSFHRLCQRVS